MNETTGGFRRRTTTAVLITFALAALADFLFYDAPIGFTVGLYGIALFLALVLRRGRFLGSAPGRWIAVGVIGLAASCVLDPGALSITLLVLGLVALGLIDRVGWTSRPGEWLLRWMRFSGRMLFQLARDIRLGRRAKRRGTVRRFSFGRAFLLWVVPITLTLLFLGLFGIANPIVEKWLGDSAESIGRFFENLSEYVNPGRLLLWILVAVFVWALLRVRTRAPATRAAADPARRTTFDQIVSPEVIVRCLILFNALFLLNNVLDSLYLWGGATLPEGMSYPEYARRGAYPLVATALLAAGFVLLSFPSGSGERRKGWATPLVYAWIAQNIFLTSSAVFRLSIYVEAFSLTRLRCAAGIWMALVAFGLATIILRILLGRSNQWLVRLNFMAALLVTYAACFVNFDGIISDYNVRHCREVKGDGPRIDLRYLTELAPDSIPALEWLASNLAESEAETAAAAAKRAEHLRARLEDRLAHWRAWTLRREGIAAGGPE